MTGYDLQLHLRYRIAFGIKKQKSNIVHAHITREFHRFLHQRWAKFPRQNNHILQKMMAGVEKEVNFKDVSRPNKEMKYFSKNHNWIQGLFKTNTKFKDLFKIVRTMSIYTGPKIQKRYNTKSMDGLSKNLFSKRYVLLSQPGKKVRNLN